MIGRKMKDFCKERQEREIVVLLSIKTVMQWMISSHCKDVKSDMVSTICQEN